MDRTVRMRIYHWLTQPVFHLGCWLLFGFLEVKGLLRIFVSSGMSVWGSTLIYYGYTISLFYFNVYKGYQWVARSSRHLLGRMLSLIGIEMLAVIILVIAISLLAHTARIHFSSSGKLQFLQNGLAFFLPFSYYIPFSIGYVALLKVKDTEEKRLQEERMREKQQLVLAEKERELWIARQDLYKAKVDTHLFFNTFADIRAYTEHPEARQLIARSTDLLRFYLKRTANGLIALAEELKHCEELLEIHRKRHRRSLQVMLLFPALDREIQVLPMLVLSLLENILKHGALFDKACPARLQVALVNGKLLVTSHNKMMPGHQALGTGNGLKNLGERLRHVYPDSHFFDYGADGELFFVHVEIDNLVKD